MSNKRFNYLECVWYFEHLKSLFKIGKRVKYRHVGNGHNAKYWGYERYRTGRIVEWEQCNNPNYLYKVKIRDSKNRQIISVHPDLLYNVDDKV